MSFALVLLVGGMGIGVWKLVIASESGMDQAVDTSGEPNGRSFVPVSMKEAGDDSRAKATAAAQAEQKKRARQKRLDEQLKPYLQTYCMDCHGPDSEEAGINVASLSSVDQFFDDRRTWERIYRMVNAGAMPPSDVDPQPSQEKQQQISELLYDELFNFDCELVSNPGRSTVQRLNRTEYNNTVRDLFGVDISPADKFPADDVGEGFDNIGDVLSLPPLLMEKYLNAAEEIAAAVIDTTDYSKPQTQALSGPELKREGAGGASQGIQLLATNGRIYGDFDVPAAGEYEIRIVARAQQMREERARFSLSAGKEKLQEFEVQTHQKDENFSRKVKLDADRVRITTAFLNDAYDANTKEDRNFGVRSITLHGPLGGATPKRSATHLRFVTHTTSDTGSVREAAFNVFRPFLKRAFRRQVSDAEADRFARLAEQAVNELGQTYEGGLSLALQAALVSPDFLFRLEKEPKAGQTERPLDDYEIASRLSYFLWSTMPDSELFQLADQGRLKDPESLRVQIGRMLQDEKSEALVSNFASQWLNLRNLDDVTPDTEKFADFSNELRRDMRRETELLFRAIMREDRSLEELLSADFTFVNHRLAKHYGISGVDNEEFERVSLNGTKRSGVLTHASILTLTSAPGRTSPVKRGKWIMENIFGEAPPPPPPNVPELTETANASPDASLREQLEKHRADPGCAACHKLMDPLGIGFENFDAIGRWRETDNGNAIDASGELASGEKFNDSLELISLIQKRREKFLRTVTDRMLVYATGRGTEYFDRCAVDQCLDLMKQRNNRFSALVEAIVLSDPFLKRSAAPPELKP